MNKISLLIGRINRKKVKIMSNDMFYKLKLYYFSRFLRIKNH